jgi:uncharacterized membrane protein YdjX (TVP38/TMEM64 family)
MKKIAPICFFFIALISLGFFAPEFSLEFVRSHFLFFKTLVSNHFFLASALFFSSYILVVVFLIPISSLLTILAGVFFPFYLGFIYVLIAATTGSLILFALAKTPFGSKIQKKIDYKVFQKVKEGVEKHQINYLMFLRLVPLFPFWAVNLIVAIMGVSLKKFLFSTFFGIMPGTFFYVLAGSGIQESFEKSGLVGVDAILNKKLTLSLAAIALFSLVPIIFSKFKNKEENK